MREYFVAQRFRTELGARMVALMDSNQLDVLVMPTTLVTAPLGLQVVAAPNEAGLALRAVGQAT